jgi:hypothetical protein
MTDAGRGDCNSLSGSRIIGGKVHDPAAGATEQAGREVIGVRYGF